ncbi:MAG: hypothetical protein ABSE41_03355 [Bacteroidota bacterium]|jgi:hypothetical protein
MDFRYLFHTEIDTQKATERELHGWLTKYPEIINVLFHAAYFTGRVDDPQSADGTFQAFAHHHLLRFPYTVRAAAILLESGYYLETVSVLRNMYEVLVQMRYFHRHKDQVMAHALRQKRVRFRTMFDEIAPGFYDPMYARLLSEYAHGGLGSMIFRTSYSAADKGTTLMGCHFDADLCTFSLNQISVVLCGWLTYIPIFFPAFPTNAPRDLLGKRQSALDWLREGMDQHVKMKPITKEFYDLVEPIISEQKSDH